MNEAVLAPPSPSPVQVFEPGTPFVEPSDTPLEPSVKSKIQQAADKGAVKAPEPVKAKEPVKPTEPAKPETPPAKPDIAKPEVAKPAAEVKPAVVAPNEKTEALHRFQKENRELKAEVERFKAAKPAEAPEVQALTKERDALKKRTAELEGEFRYVNYEKSPEFLEKYLRPYENLQKSLSAEATELFIDAPDGTVRALTQDEFWSVATQPDLNSAVKAARDLFPEDPTKVNILIDFRKQIKRSWDTLNAAKQEFRTKGAERDQQRRSQLEESSQAEKAQYQKEVAALADEFPDDFKPGEDTAENELRTKYAKIVDETLDSDKPNLKNVARLRHAGIAYPLIKSKLTAALKTIEEQKAKLESFERSVPTGGQPPEIEGGASGEETVGQKLAKLANR